MAKKLCVNIDMFTLNQDIFLVDEHSIQRVAIVPMDKVKETMYSLLNEKNEINEINLNGSQDYIQQIGYEILEGLKKFYSDINVRVKLNGKVFN